MKQRLENDAKEREKQTIVAKKVSNNASSDRGSLQKFHGKLWAAVFTFNPYLLISINELLISIIHLLISINELLMSIIHLLISIKMAVSSLFIYINNSFIDINKGIIDINNSFIDINKYG